MQRAAPWDLKKPGDEVELSRVIYLCAESIRICGILLQPYMPAKMKQLLDIMGVADGSRLYDNTALGSDKEYGNPRDAMGKGSQETLFPPLSSYF